jgi:hypothetical protein
MIQLMDKVPNHLKSPMMAAKQPGGVQYRFRPLARTIDFSEVLFVDTDLNKDGTFIEDQLVHELTASKLLPWVIGSPDHRLINDEEETCDIETIVSHEIRDGALFYKVKFELYDARYNVFYNAEELHVAEAKAVQEYCSSVGVNSPDELTSQN